MGESTDETVPVQRGASEDAVQTSLELRIRYSDRPRQVVPLNRAAVEHSVDGTLLRFSYQGGRVLFRSSCKVYKDGQAVEHGVLEVGGALEVGSHRVLLWDAGDPVAYLKGYSPPYSNELWPLGPGTYPVGRPGKRPNAIQLDHPTVSREHATILAGEGGYRILAESATNPVYLRGEEVKAGSTCELHHGDLIELGELVFRFHQPERSPASSDQEASLRVRSFGGLAVQLAGTLLSDRAWKTQYVKWMFAHLAYQWGAPLGVEVLMDELWPDSDPARARKNFNYSLSVLRSALRDHAPASLKATEIVLRSSSALQLNPDLLDRHDAVQLQRLARARPAEEDREWEQAAQAAVLDYAGPFLPECYLDWAVTARQSLELQVIELARSLLPRLEHRQDFEAILAVASQVMQIDRQDQWACLQVMRALRQRGRLSEAVRVFERSRVLWREELGLEPEAALLREHEQILALL